MILFTGGFPYSGKSEFVRCLWTELGWPIPGANTPQMSDILIEPKSFYPQGFDNLPEEKQRAIAIACWDVCIEELSETIIKTSPTDLIIFDTSAKRLHMMRPLFVNAKTRHHPIFYVFVGASTEECKRRAGSKWKDSFEEDYASSFEVTVPNLKRMSDVFKLIINNDDPNRTKLHNVAEEIAFMIREIRT